MLRNDVFIKSVLALTAWREGKGNSNNMRLVAGAIGNRVRSGWGSWLEVIEKIPVHAAYNVNEQPGGYPQIWDQSFQRLLSEIDGIYDNSYENHTGGGLYWADLHGITREWFLENVSRNPEHKRVATSGTFYLWS